MGGNLSLQESDPIFLFFPLTHKYAMKGFYEEFTLQELSVAIFKFMMFVVLEKRAFKLPLYLILILLSYLWEFSSFWAI